VDVVRGLTEGADAYLAKPVEIDVLVATLHSVARRLRPSTQVEGAAWRLSSDEWFLLSPGGGKVKLSKAERRLLDAFMRQPNEVILRESLIAALTDDVDGFDPHRLESLIHRLRRKVLANVGEPLPLAAVHGTGYVLAT
jgi:DNA-binding response OmpR family regulator